MKRQDAWVKGIGKKRMRILAGMLGFCVLVTTCPDMPAPRSVSAAEEMTETGEQYISGFARLSEEIREQTVPVGTALEELTLPDTLEAVVTAAGESQPPEDTEDQPGDDGKEDAGENDGKEDGGATGGDVDDGGNGGNEDGSASDGESGDGGNGDKEDGGASDGESGDGESGGNEDGGASDRESGDGESGDKEDDGTTGGEGGTEEGEPSGTEQEDARNGYGTDAETAENGAGESAFLEERGGRAAVRESASTVERQESGSTQETHTVTLPEYYAEHVISVQTLENIQTEAQVDSEKKEKEETAAEEQQEPQKKAQEETHTVSGITWQSAPAYDGNTEGIYTFTAVLPEGYALAEGVSLPEITVTVQEIVRRAMARAAMAASDWGGTGVDKVYVSGSSIWGYGNNLTITQGSTADTTKLYYTSGTELIGPIDLSPAEGSIADGFHTEQWELCTTGGQYDYSSYDVVTHMNGGILERIWNLKSNAGTPRSYQVFMSGGTLLTESEAILANVVDISGDSAIKGSVRFADSLSVSGSPQIGGEGKGILIASGTTFTVKGALSNASIYVKPQADFADGTQIAQAASGYTITKSDLAQMKLTGSYVEGKELYLENNAIYIRVKPEVPHTVTYNYSANGGNAATQTSDTVLEGAAVDLTPTAAKDGWEFVGWNTEQNAHAGLTTLTMGEADVTLYAIYKKTLTASFYSGSAGVKETVSTTIYNNATVGSVKAPAMKTWAEAAESGYTAWHYSSGEFSGKNIDPGKTVSLSLAAGEVSYYGLYKKNITVSYDANGGTGSADSKTVERQASVHEKVAYWTTPSVTLHDGAGFVRNGYTFNGWIAGSPNGTNIVKAGTSVRPTGDTVYYASWKPNTYIVTLDTNGGSGGTNLTSYTYGIEKVLPTDWTKTGYTFAGWYTDSGFAGTAVTKIKATDTGVKTYYAKWTPNTYTVTYNKNNGTIANESNYTSYTYGTGLTLPTPTRTGYTFDGWYENAGFTGNKVTGISTSATGGKTYYAKWTANTYTVTYNNDSGTIANESAYTKYTYGTGLTLPTPARRGYSFSGWYDNADCTGTAVTAISATDIGDKTFYAKWTDDIAPVIDMLRYSYKPASMWHWLIGKDSLIITVPVIEEGSGADEITYTVTPKSGVAEEKTAALTNGTAKITVSADFKGEILIVCTDKAGNVAADVTVGASLDAAGVIIEDNALDIVIKADRSSSDTQQTQPGGVAVEDRYYETVPALLVTVRDDMDNAITGGLDTIAYQVGNGAKKPVAFDKSNLQKAAQAAFTIPASEIPAGITEITVTAVDNAGNRAAKTLTIKVKGSENKPAAEIDYRKEKLTGLAAGGTYRINDTEYTADGEGCIPIKEEWMGTTVTVVKAGNGSETTDSPAQNLPIPARPAKPKPTGEDVAVPGGTGKLTGLAADTAYEISTDGGKTWVSRRADGNGVITGLAPGAYTVRVEVGASNFSSENSSPARIGAYQIKVTFVAEGETYKEVFVDYGGTLADIPSVPPVEDAVGAWCSDRQGTPAVFTNITADMTVYAVYTHYYTVTLQDGAGYTLTVETGSESPVKEGGSFTFRFALGKGYQKTKNFALKVNGGETIEIRVDVTDISEKVPEQDKEVIESGVEVYREETPGLVLGMYVDISMFIKIGEGDWNAIATTDEPIEVVIGIPEKLQSDGREFYIIRAHEGEHTLLRDLDGAPDTITVSTDMFSSYAIAYEETEGAGADRKCGLCHICPTFLGICYFIWLAVILAVAGIVIYVVLRRRKEEETEGEK